MTPAALSRMIFAACTLVLSACATAPERASPPAWGVQLYTLRNSMAEDPVGTVRRAAALGAVEVEYAGTHGTPPAELCAETRRLGVHVAAAHADWKQLRDDPAAAIAEAKSLCADTIILAWTPPEERRTLDQWRGWIAVLNRVAVLAREQGMGTAYHAHDFEFALIDGVRPIDLLFADLDPAIGFELDTYWVAKAGEDPLAFLKAHRGRVTHLHLKDMGADGSMADVGHGVLPMAQIIAQARAQGVTHFLVERDDAPDQWASLQASLDYLRTMPFQPR